jgi:hypothetical protein
MSAQPTAMQKARSRHGSRGKTENKAAQERRGGKYKGSVVGSDRTQPTVGGVLYAYGTLSCNGCDTCVTGDVLCRCRCVFTHHSTVPYVRVCVCVCVCSVAPRIVLLLCKICACSMLCSGKRIHERISPMCRLRDGDVSPCVSPSSMCGFQVPATRWHPNPRPAAGTGVPS